MRKSKNIFMIMAVIYCGVAVLGEFEYLTISDNILIGLSLSALLSSSSDILGGRPLRVALLCGFDTLCRQCIKAAISAYNKISYAVFGYVALNLRARASYNHHIVKIIIKFGYKRFAGIEIFIQICYSTW